MIIDSPASVEGRRPEVSMAVRKWWCFGTYVANTRSGQAAFDARRARLLKDMEQGQAQPPAD